MMATTLEFVRLLNRRSLLQLILSFVKMQGDNGGPVNCGQDLNVVVGLASWWIGRNCEERAPNVFTRISSYRNWITNNTQVPNRGGSLQF